MSGSNSTFSNRITLTNHPCKQLVPAVLLAGYLLMASCSQRQASSGDEKKVDPVAQTEPKFQPLPQTAPMVANLRPVASKGDCAPKYASGLHGSCINNAPCRGFGVIDEKGQPVCACFAKAGGCNQGDRCDIIKKACVSEKEPGFGRMPDD